MRVVETERRKVSFQLRDHKAIDAWQTNLKLNGTPLATFYESWNKVNLQQMAKRATNNEKVNHIRNFMAYTVQLLWVKIIKYDRQNVKLQRRLAEKCGIK